MTIKKAEVLIVGAGQAGIALSEHLTKAEVPHVVLERDRIAERWRTERWDSLVANGPAWHDRFPNMKITNVADDEFASKDQMAAYFEEYAAMIGAPVRTGVDVTAVDRKEHEPGFTVQTTEGTWDARFVVAATGPFQKPVIPAVVEDSAGIHQIHSSHYHRPRQLPEGGVLVVGAGSSGVQIADELREAGREVYLAVGPHDRPPRRYRNRDFVWWLGVLGKWDMATPPKGAEHVTISVSGANGGETVDFRDLAAKGVTLVGRAGPWADGVMKFADDLAENIHAGDDNYLSLLREADEYIEAHGLDLPPEPEAHELGPDPECVVNPLRELNLAAAGVTSIIWATGFSQDYSWLHVDSFDEKGRPIHQRGVAKAEGIYFLGLPWQSRRGSSFIWGVWHDARYIADQIQIQRTYAAYTGNATRIEKPSTVVAAHAHKPEAPEAFLSEADPVITNEAVTTV